MIRLTILSCHGMLSPKENSIRGADGSRLRGGQKRLQTHEPDLGNASVGNKIETSAWRAPRIFILEVSSCGKEKLYTG